MPNVLAPQLTLPAKSFPNPSIAASGLLGEFLTTDVLPRYSTLGKLGRLQVAYALLAASSPVIYSTNTLTGGPFLWNPPGSGVDAHIIGMSVTQSTVASTGTAGGFGITFGTQTVIPTALTAIDSFGNLLPGGPASALNVYRTATPTTAGGGFIATFQVGLTANTAEFCAAFVELAGALIVPPGNFASLAGSSTMTNGVYRTSLIWAELPT